MKLLITSKIRRNKQRLKKKGVDRMFEELNKYDPFFEGDLNKYELAQLSVEPNVPGRDELINHKIIGHQMFDTKTGKLLLLNLRNIETGEEYTYSYPDIQRIEVNSSSTAEFQKYYLSCLNREVAFLINYIKTTISKGIPITEDEKAFLRDNKEEMTFRIMLTNRKK